MPDYEMLIARARAAAGNAYVPYSDFRTGAAVQTESGSIHVGALIENLVFGLAMCAERVALFGAIASGADRPTVLAIAAPATAGRRTFPCGPCLQVAAEFAGPELIVVAGGLDGDDYDVRTVDELAPGLPRRNKPLR